MFCQNCGNKLKPRIRICPKCGYSNSSNSKKILLPALLSLILITVVSIAVYGLLDKKFRLNTLFITGLSKKSYCDYQITELKDYKFPLDFNYINKLESQIQRAVDSWNGGFLNWEAMDLRNKRNQAYIDGRTIYYEAYIKNNSQYSQKLVNIHAKLKTEENLYITEAWSQNYNVTLDPGDSFPIKFKFYLNDFKDVEKYIDDKNIKLKTDIYPWFETCEY
jgi:hypothetical protein